MILASPTYIRMPYVLILASLHSTILASATLAAEPTGRTGWQHVESILRSIQAPQFPDRRISIVEHGASPGGKVDCRGAIQAAVDACSQRGGGQVAIPAGTWLVSGPLRLRSRVRLHLDEKAVLLFSPNPDDYLPVVFTRFEGTELMNYSPLVYAIDAEDIAITGGGTFDGQADQKNWWAWKAKGDPDIAKLTGLAEEGVPPEQRVFGKGFHLRPNFVQFYRCRNVSIDGLTIKRSPMWLLHPVQCENVIVRNYTADSHGPNNDGCNPESCRNVLIEDSSFDTGDDCIAIKSGRNADGRRLSAPSENIIVRRCSMKDGHGGVVLGSEMSGGIRRVFVEDCVMDSPQLERAIRLKSNSMRGGYLEDLFVRNVKVGEVSDAVVHVFLKYGSDRGDYPPRVRNILIEGVESQKSNHPIYLVGLEEMPIQGVVLKDCMFRNNKVPSVIEAVEDMAFQNVWLPDKKSNYSEIPGLRTTPASPPHSDAPQPRLSYTREDDGISIYVDDQLFTRYVIRSNTRPVLWPIIGPTGQPMTRAYPVGPQAAGEPTDHIHHRSMWIGYEGVNGVDTWHEPEKGKTRPFSIGSVRHRGFPRVESDGESVVLVAINDWLNDQDQIVCSDERTLRFGANDSARWIDVQLRLWNDQKGLSIGDSKEGMIALRVAASMAVDAGLGGKIVNSRGILDADAWGEPAEWVDYHGPLNGEVVGIAMMAHPTSDVPIPRWHVRPYGLFAANPFGDSAFDDPPAATRTTLRGPTESIQLRYRMLLHRGNEQDARIADQYRIWSQAFGTN